MKINIHFPQFLMEAMFTSTNFDPALFGYKDEGISAVFCKDFVIVFIFVRFKGRLI